VEFIFFAMRGMPSRRERDAMARGALPFPLSRFRDVLNRALVVRLCLATRRRDAAFVAPLARLPAYALRWRGARAAAGVRAGAATRVAALPV